MMVFCEHCHDVVEYEVRDQSMTRVVRGKELNFEGREAYCGECDQPVFVAEIRDYNLMVMDEAFRSRENLVRVSDIQRVLDQYQIGKRPLSLLLGWGEGTVTRYLEGDIPTKQYSDTIKKLLEDTAFFRELLESHSDRITTVAYERSKKALEGLMETETTYVSQRTGSKIDHVVSYLLKECADITPLALQKLLYYAQGLSKAFNGEYLFQNDCEAWVHGPVYREIYNKYKGYGFNPIENGLRDSADDELSEAERELLDTIVRNFGCYSGKILEKMTHIETPWMISRKGLKDGEASDRVIEKRLLAEYFGDIKEKYKMLNLSDVRDYSADLFSKINGIR